MIGIAISIFALLLSTAALLLGIGLQGTLLGLRAGVENYSMTMTGIVMSSYFVGFALGSYYCPRIIRDFGHIRAYAAMAAMASAAAISYAINTDPWVWIVLRILTGFCIVGLYVVIESWLNALASNTMRGRYFGIYMIITLLAMAGGQHLLRLGEVASFELFAVTTILISLSLIPVVLTRIPQPEISESKHFHLKQLYAISPLGVVGSLSAGLVTGSFWGLGALYAKQTGLDETGVAWLMSAIILGGATLQWPLGLLSDVIDRRRIITLCSFTGAGLALFNSMISIDNSWLFYLVSFFFGGFIFTLYALSVAHANDRIDPDHSLEAAQGLLQLYGIGAIIGPLLTSQALEYFGPKGMLIFFAIIMTALGMFTLHRMHYKTAPPVEEQTEFIPLARTSPVALEMSSLNETPLSSEDDN
ncbi:MAG: MFS transporter [Gammaproteobacteria bacterium]|nr:MFS transporter [Gammaproteobacteria bacterium]MCW8910607.1 MFS transporter [Gammaproteobacteria bacterium]MCW9003849.1 MFS transporter [Gammaproteobacteria bacterium]